MVNEHSTAGAIARRNLQQIYDRLPVDLQRSASDLVEAAIRFAAAEGFLAGRDGSGLTVEEWLDAGRPAYRFGTWLRPVTSTHLAAVGWRRAPSAPTHAADPIGILVIQFVNGPAFEYANVPESRYTAIITAESPGAVFAVSIRYKTEQFPFTKLSEGVAQ